MRLGARRVLVSLLVALSSLVVTLMRPIIVSRQLPRDFKCFKPLGVRVAFRSIRGFGSEFSAKLLVFIGGF